MNKKILAIPICIAIVAGMYAASVVSAANDYTLTVESIQNTGLTFNNGTFGTLLAGNTGYINNTFTLVNSGNVAANVTAAFTTFNTTANIYGMNSTADNIAIPGTSFALGSQVAQTYKALGATSTGVLMDDQAPAGGASENWDIRVMVPAGQAAKSYAGTIEITFG